MTGWITWICRRVQQLFQGWEVYQCLHELGYGSLILYKLCQLIPFRYDCLATDRDPSTDWFRLVRPCIVSALTFYTEVCDRDRTNTALTAFSKKLVSTYREYSTVLPTTHPLIRL